MRLVRLLPRWCDRRKWRGYPHWIVDQAVKDRFGQPIS
jgi:hypothetical protein